MKILNQLLNNTKSIYTKGDTNIEVTSISINSNNILEGSLFVALVGNLTDGHLFIDEVISNGAKVIVHEKEVHSYVEGVTYIKVEDTHEALAHIACEFFDNPSSKLKLIGITGTNGKTTTATLLHQLFRNLGHKAGMIGTVVNKINDQSFEAIRTTPDSISLNTILKNMVDDGCEYCFMEVSSHSVSEKRITGLTFSGGVFTNLTHDHLDYHKTFEHYRDAKKGFFDGLGLDTFAVSNKDDENGEYMLHDTKAKKYLYSLKTDADFNIRLETKLIGEFNAYNALAIYGVAIALGQDKDKVKGEMKKLEPVPGRFQYIKSSTGVTGVVDYAHTPDALENVLRTINDMKNNHKVISLFGCGGDRDRTKRPIMAKIGYEMSDVLILTSDNPRTESPESIMNDMEHGIPTLPNEKVHIVLDRREAIDLACGIANPGDYILLAGKGHENYQEVNGVKNHFDDLEELNRCFNV